MREGFDDVAALLKRAQRDGNTLTKELSEETGTSLSVLKRFWFAPQVPKSRLVCIQFLLLLLHIPDPTTRNFTSDP